MTNQFSKKVSDILLQSKEEARRTDYAAVMPEHLLLGLMQDETGPVNVLLRNENINRQAVQKELEERLSQEQSANNAKGDAFDRMAATDNEVMLTEKATNILRLAVLEARLQHAMQVEPEHLVLAILHDNSGNGAKEVLTLNNISYDDAKRCFEHKHSQMTDGLDLPDEDYASSDGDSRADSNSSATGTDSKTQQNSHSQTPILDRFSTDLTVTAAEGKLDPVVGREEEIQRVTEILCRRKKNNPILIGEPGVGKSAIVEGLAQLIARKRVSPVLFNKRIVSLNMTSIVAGTKYRGQFEERIQALLKEIEANPDIIVFIDEIHTIIGAGSTPGSMDAANIMKPALARGKFQCIGATTLDEYRNSIEKDGALERRFQKVLVNATTEAETAEILENIRERYEEFHHVAYTPEALKACVRLTGRYISERAFPDKAIDALDEAGAKVHLTNAHVPDYIVEKEKEIDEVKRMKDQAVADQNYEEAAKHRDRQTKLMNELKVLNDEWLNSDEYRRYSVTEDDVANVVSVMSGIPVQRIAQSEGEQLRTLADKLRGAVVGQDKAIEKTVKAIQRNRIGLKDPNKPIGVFMFLGPTGVGKTYLTKKLAEELFGSADSLIRVDMSEYSEKFNTSRLIGAPPGYVGYDEGGQLTEKVRRHPYSIVLLDEIEKAHSSVFNMLLQVFDEGRLTDGNGRLVDFRNTIVIMTSNTGTKQLKDFGRGVGFNASSFDGTDISEKDKEYARSIIQKSLSRQFAPEFLNRLDDIVMFDQLDRQALLQITGMEIGKFTKRMEGIGYHVEVTEKAQEYVATKGYDVQFGARPLKRAIQTYIEDGICAHILDGSFEADKPIIIDRDGDSGELTFHQ
ncbi:MAG: ATP-dependent Clp protease ATP-binding subunit [Prevotella sp.]|nr:ATP-dependent Clp protease ATP-binding subunit [Prevotella sp.]